MTVAEGAGSDNCGLMGFDYVTRREKREIV